MPSVTVSVEADVATWSSGIAAGAGNHLPIGAYGSADYRSAMRFPLPSGFAGWTSITKAVLNFYISDFDHVGPRNSTILIRRMSVAGGIWTKAAGSSNCESGFAASNNTQYGDISPVTGASQYTFDSGTTANAKKSVNVTGIVREYHDAGASKLVFVFDNSGSGDYTELWADERSGYDATLVIDYEDAAPPNAPTQTAPAAGATSITQTPTFDWTHSDPDGDPQVSAEVRLWNSTGGTLIDTFPVVGATSSLVCPTVLVRGTTYQWDVRTADASGYGAYSAKRSVIIKAAPVTTITNTRFMEMSGGAPRLRVKWTCTQTQSKYRIQAGAYDSGWVTSTSQNVLLSTLALTNGTAVSVTVTVETTDGLQDADTRSFTPRWGLTVHRRDLTTPPVSWGTPSVVSTVPSGCQLVVEYGSNSAAGAAPTAWYSTLSSAPKARYVYWRAWFIPSATAGPQLDKVTIPANFTVQTVDKWYSNTTGAAIGGAWSIDSGEYVYGSRSIVAENTGALTYIFSGRIPVRAGRSYILTGLMKAEGNSGAYFGIYDPDVLSFVEQDGQYVLTDPLTETRDWFEASAYDVYRYKTPVWVAPADMDVMVSLRSNGVAGTSSWFDAIKLEESTVATPWSPGAIGAVVVDAGGIQVDGTKGGVFRMRGSVGGVRDIVELGPNTLNFGGDVVLDSPVANMLRSNSEWRSRRLAATDAAFAAHVSSEQFLRWLTRMDGLQAWGPGNATYDTYLSRSGTGGLTHSAPNPFDAASGLTVPITGSATPSFNNGGSWAVGSVVCSYIKIGRLVVFRLSWTNTAAGSGASVVTVTGTGFPGSGGYRVMGDRGGSGVEPVIARMLNSGGVSTIAGISTAAAPTAILTGAGMLNGANYAFHGAYLADA